MHILIWGDEQVYGIEAAKGALVGQAGAASAYLLVTEVYAQLLRTHHEQLSVETGTPALKIQRTDDGEYPYSITTPRGVIGAKHIIHCTEGHMSHLVPALQGISVPPRGQMTVCNPGQTFKGSKGKRSWSFYFNTGFDYLSQNEHTSEPSVGGGDLGGLATGLEVHVFSPTQRRLPS